MTDKKIPPLDPLWLFFIACISFIILIPLAGIAVNVSETLDVFFGTNFFTTKSARGSSFEMFLLILVVFLLYWTFWFLKESSLKRTTLSVDDSAFWLRKELHLEVDEVNKIIQGISEKYFEAIQESDISMVEDLLWRKSYEKIKKQIDAKERTLKDRKKISVKNIEIMYIESILDNLTADRLSIIISYGEEWIETEFIKENWIIEKNEDSKQWIVQDITPIKLKEAEFQFDGTEKSFEYNQNNII